MSDHIPLRFSHLLGYSSVGAIVRGPDYLVTVKDIREWTDKNGEIAARLIPYVDQVRSALGIEKELREPPVARKLADGRIDGVCIPAMRFPFWMRCPRCGLLYYRPWRGLPKGEKPRCTNSENGKCLNHPPLEQISWVMVHAHGYMADVPWHWLAHSGARKPEQSQCRFDRDAANLSLTEAEPFSGKRTIRCQTCGSWGTFYNEMRTPFGNRSPQPWLKPASPAANRPDAMADKDTPALVLRVNDARVHFPSVENALVIPPESRVRKGTVTDRLYRSTQKRQRIDRARTPLARQGEIRSIASEFRCAPKEVEAAWKDIQEGYPLYGKSLTPGLLLEDEYKALLEELADVSDDEDFITRHHTPLWRSLGEKLSKPSRVYAGLKSIDRLIAVTRLKEIQVSFGFRRCDTESSVLVPPDIDGDCNWLPAIELYGEGIFFTLDETALQRWEQHPKLLERALSFEDRCEQATVLTTDRDLKITPRFLLMHTLSHILIRQLESEAGYPAASLKERIYCKGGKDPMSGILIYVAVPDVAGSLGGLVEQAEPMRFLKLITGVFDHADWCSFDPMCAEHEGQGPQMLNRAACHACSLIPEPGCPYKNMLLDRVFIKGELTEGIPSFLDHVDLKG